MIVNVGIATKGHSKLMTPFIKSFLNIIQANIEKNDQFTLTSLRHFLLGLMFCCPGNGTKNSHQNNFFTFSLDKFCFLTLFDLNQTFLSFELLGVSILSTVMKVTETT